MGEGGTGKSTTTRALTGIYRSSHKDVETNQGTLRNVFVQIRSLQEINATPQQFVSEYSNEQFILVSLRVGHPNTTNNGLDYVHHFVNMGWDIRKIVVLNRNNLPFSLPTSIQTPLYIPNSKNLPANQIAHLIRNNWNWR